ncbi:MAG: IclR family transcriptional regulator C-terminal domain-containing protein [Mycobacterium sp.]
MSNADYVQSLARGLGVIRAFSDQHPRQTVTSIAQHCELSRPAARRFLLTLQELGYISGNGTHYWLTPRVLELGRSYLASLSLPDLAQSHLTELSTAINESSSMAVLDGADIIYVARVQVRRIMSMTIVVGTRHSAAATSMGRVLLSGLPDIKREEYVRGMSLPEYTSGSVASREEFGAELRRVRAQGFCIVDHKLDYGLRSVAAPVHDRNGSTIAAISVSAQSAIFPAARFDDELLPQLVATARRISVDVGHAGMLTSYA